MPAQAETAPVLMVVPPYPAEAVFTETPRTEDAALALRQEGDARCALLAGGASRTFWRSFHLDPLLLMLNPIGQAPRCSQKGHIGEFTIPELKDYGVAALE